MVSESICFILASLSLSDLLDPLAEAMVRDESVGELYRQLDPADMLYDYLIGSTIGLFGSGADIAAGRNAEANRALRDLDANEAAYLRRMEEIGHLRPEGDKNATLDRAAEEARENGETQKSSDLQHTTKEIIKERPQIPLWYRLPNTGWQGFSDKSIRGISIF